MLENVSENFWKCREMSENDRELFFTYLIYLNTILTFDFLHIGKEK